MKNSDIKDPLFLEAVEAIDSGNMPLLQQLLTDHPELLHKPLTTPGEEGYFKNPYLLWFIADNPIRHEKLPANIIAITNLIIKTARRENVSTLQHQLNYTLGLVATGRIPRESGVQIELIDLLIDEGASPGGGVGALAHGNINAAAHLIERGGELTLATAICLDRKDDIARLAPLSDMAARQLAFIAAAFYGKADMLSYLIRLGVDVNAYLDPKQSKGFHSHATALHQAVYSGSLESVKLIVEAGANLQLRDRVYNGTPLDWAEYCQTEQTDENEIKKLKMIAAYLKEKQRS